MTLRIIFKIFVDILLFTTLITTTIHAVNGDYILNVIFGYGLSALFYAVRVYDDFTIMKQKYINTDNNDV